MLRLFLFQNSVLKLSHCAFLGNSSNLSKSQIHCPLKGTVIEDDGIKAPDIVPIQRCQPYNNIWSKKPLWEFQKSAETLQYPQANTNPRTVTLKSVRNSTAFNQRKYLTYSFSLERERKNCVWCSSFWDSCLRDWFLICLTQSNDGELAYFGCLRASKNRAQWLVAPTENLQYCTQTLEAARDYELLERKHANLSYWEISYNCPDKMHPQKRIERHMESLQADGWNSSPVWNQSIKIWRVGCFFKMYKFQQKKKKWGI